MASNDEIQAVAMECARCLAGIPNPIERLPSTVRTTNQAGRFTPSEMELITKLATRQIVGPAIEEAAQHGPLN